MSLAPLRITLLRVSFLLTLALPIGARAACNDLLRDGGAAPAQDRMVTPLDLARLRQIGQPEDALYFRSSALGVSPDGAKVAFVIYRGDPVTNSYCVGLAVLDVGGDGHEPRLPNQGGELILTSNAYRGLITPIGFPDLITPQWSPDGRSIAYLRRDGGRTQVWVAGAQGGSARQATHAPVDIAQFAWRADGKAIVYSARTGLLKQQMADAAAALAGFHYDDRYEPMMYSTPMASASMPLTRYALDLGTGAVRAPKKAEADLLPPDALGQFPPPVGAISQDGQRAVTERDTANYFAMRRVSIKEPDGTTVRCGVAACVGRFIGMWWEPHGGPLVFERRAGWAGGDVAFYRWQPEKGDPQLVLRTADVIADCAQAGTKLICLREGLTAPRRIVSLDPMSGRSADLYEPNPNFGHLRLGAAQRLAWRNAQGAEVRGDLVLPPGYRRGTRIPLIVTTYVSDGFLRGGTGDEYPIQVFAAHGFAVLSTNRPEIVSTDAKATSYLAAQKAASDDWGERRSLNSAVLAGVQQVIDMGVADPARIGITGLSDGASTVGFALINSHRFAAAAISTCCLEPWMVNATTGPAFAALMRQQGWPAVTADDRAFWAPVSLIQNAASIDTPLLMQLADHEYLPGVDVWAALREQGKPVDMYVFPDEYHIKWQPAHRLAAYTRNLDWFDFWLQDRIDPDPAKQDEYAEWERLRAKTPRKAEVVP